MLFIKHHISKSLLIFLVLNFLQKLVVKPDQLIKRRGKLGLIKVNTDLAGVKQWVTERMGRDQQVHPDINHCFLCYLVRGTTFLDYHPYFYHVITW